MNQCRLCGEEKSPLDFSIELNDRTTLNWSYRELIEHHTRISLKTNKLLPQSICEECQIRIEGFAEFTLRLEAVQNSLEAQDDQCETKDSIVQIENNEEHLETVEYEFAESSNSLVSFHHQRNFMSALFSLIDFRLPKVMDTVKNSSTNTFLILRR